MIVERFDECFSKQNFRLAFNLNDDTILLIERESTYPAHGIVMIFILMVFSSYGK